MKSRANIKNLIIGAGNILLSDEGIGIHVLKELEKYFAGKPSVTDCPDNIFRETCFIDIGTSSYDIGLHLSVDVKKIVIIDCIKAPGHKPGTLFKLGIDDLRKRQKESFSLHQVELLDSLKILSITSELPRTLILGVVPEKTDVFSLELSAALKAKFPEIISKTIKEIEEFFKQDA